MRLFGLAIYIYYYICIYIYIYISIFTYRFLSRSRSISNVSPPSSGIVTESDGAKVIFPPGTKHAQPLIVQKGDGGFGYDSTDMAAIWYRLLELQVHRRYSHGRHNLGNSRLDTGH